MKLTEVLHMGGASQMVQPSTFIQQQVVQPTTHQATDPSQTMYNKKAKKTYTQEKIDTSEFNKNKEDQLKNYFDGEINYADERLNKMIMKLEKGN